MKKILILVLPFLLFSCFGESAEVKKAKEELLGTNSGTVNSESVDDISSETLQEQKQEEKSYYDINYLTPDKFIDIEPITNIETIKEELDIKGIVNNPDIEKIKVSFENSTSKFPIDENYGLKTFKKGDTSFLYRAYKKYEVLDYGLNKYTIDAYVGDNLVSKVELEVYIADPSKIIENQTEEKILNSTGIVNSFSGDNIENIPTTNDELLGLNCENLGDYLKQNYTWYYWNTCRPITDETNFSVNILSLSGDEYRYEKHYFSAKLGTHSKMLLESGTGIQQTNLQAKNDELKAKTFDRTTDSDKLFKDLLK